MPGLDQLAVDRGLLAHRLQPGAVQEGRAQRVRCAECLVEPGDGGGRALEGAGEVGARGRGGQVGQSGPRRRVVEQVHLPL
ncbi:MAG TPA: hypothetical protein VGC42_26315, partial [Kofleriaceae bacterium]